MEQLCGWPHMKMGPVCPPVSTSLSYTDSSKHRIVEQFEQASPETRIQKQRHWQSQHSCMDWVGM